MPVRLCRIRRRAAATAAILLLAASGAVASPVEDAYVAGYTAAVLERDLHLSARSLAVHDGVITLDAGAVAPARRRQVIAVLSRIAGVRRVEIVSPPGPRAAPPSVAAAPSPTTPTTAPPPTTVAAAAAQPEHGFVVLPRRQLFQPLMADPRWPHFSASFIHIVNSPELNDGAAVSFGEVLPLLGGDAPFGGRWQIGVLGAAFSLFDRGSASEDLINTDYFVGVPINWRNGRWSAQLRYLHQSSHLGDEFLLRGTGTQRVNLSFEQADLRVSYDLGSEYRIYGGGGAILRSEPHHEHLLVQGGFEYAADWRFLDGLLRPVAGIDLQSREFQQWQPDLSVRAGVEIASPFSFGRKVQLLLEYYNGKSPAGQFLHESIQYWGLGFHFYF